MCGIAGSWDRQGAMPSDQVARIVRAMTARLVHRGPDGEGLWKDDAAGIALGQRRLAIIDLSDAGAQPMASACGRYVITYNGEIYNAADLRPELEARGVRCRGHSDTEVLLEACATWGVRAAIERSVGMFAFALFDRRERRLTLARDRLGIKPLYWTDHAGCVAFSSELGAFDAWDAWDPSLDEAAVQDYLRYACVPAPRTIFAEAHKLEPGQLLEFDANGEPRSERYWRLEDVVREGVERPAGLADDDATERLEALLGEAVRARLVSDVPLGAFLSGGIDSSTVVALMQKHSPAPVKTFTIGFEDAGYDEAGHAGRIAAHLGTEHTELRVTPEDARAVIPRLPGMYGEPFADSSQIPTYLISALTRQSVTVALSGDGGDEVFAGYNRHVQASRLAAWQRPGLGAAARLAGRAVSGLSPAAWNRVFGLVPAGLRPRQAGEKMHKLGQVLGQDGDRLYRTLTSIWPDPGRLSAPSRNGTPAWSARDGDPELGPVERIQFLDTRGYLQDDVLTKVDRASMAVGLEVRVPILDHRVVAFAWSLDAGQRVRSGTGKWMLRRLLARHVPQSLFERPKMGFAVPIDGWLRGPLREWAGDLLASAKAANGGRFEAGPIDAAWSDHLSGRRNTQHALWTVLMFEAWRRERAG